MMYHNHEIGQDTINYNNKKKLSVTFYVSYKKLFAKLIEIFLLILIICEQQNKAAAKQYILLIFT